jgi:hypothetical protein
MAKLVIWILAKVATATLEAIVIDALAGRARQALAQLPAEGALDLLPVTTGDDEPETITAEAEVLPEVDPAIMHLAELLARALDERGQGTVQAVVPGGPALPGVSIVLVTQELAQAPQDEDLAA